MRAARLAALLPFALVGCINEVSVSAPTVAVDESFEQLGDCQSFIVPNDDEGSAEEMNAMAAAPGSNRRTVFLNFNGGTYAPGNDNSTANTSSIPGFNARIVPYEGGTAGRAQLLQCVKDQFRRFDIAFTDVDPGAVPHIEAVIGGTSNQIGMGPIGGISPMHGDCSIVERSVVFVFSGNLSGLQNTCEVTAHEVSHSLGLEHEYLCEDPMTYLYGCGNKTFQDRAVSCGEYSPRACMCGNTQNSVQELMQKLGPVTTTTTPPADPPADPADPIDPSGPPADTSAPVVALGVPADGAVLTGNSPLEVSVTASDADGIADVDLLWQFNGLRIFNCASPPQGFACRQEGDVFTWTLPVGTGARSWSVRATDGAGDVSTTEVRSLTLTTAQTQPPVGPSVSLSGPLEGASVAAGSTVQIRTDAAGDVGQVWLWWILPNGSYRAYALSPLGGSTWGLDLAVSAAAAPGRRILRAAAYDRAGSQTVARDVSIVITP
jgi:hypothetical protein